MHVCMRVHMFVRVRVCVIGCVRVRVPVCLRVQVRRRRKCTAGRRQGK